MLDQRRYIFKSDCLFYMYQLGRGYASNVLVGQMAEAWIVFWVTNAMAAVMVNNLNDIAILYTVVKLFEE